MVYFAGFRGFCRSSLKEQFNQKFNFAEILLTLRLSKM